VQLPTARLTDKILTEHLQTKQLILNNNEMSVSVKEKHGNERDAKGEIWGKWIFATTNFNDM